MVDGEQSAWLVLQSGIESDQRIRTNAVPKPKPGKWSMWLSVETFWRKVAGTGRLKRILQSWFSYLTQIFTDLYRAFRAATADQRYLKASTAQHYQKIIKDLMRKLAGCMTHSQSNFLLDWFLCSYQCYKFSAQRSGSWRVESASQLLDWSAWGFDEFLRWFSKHIFQSILRWFQKFHLYLGKISDLAKFFKMVWIETTFRWATISSILPRWISDMPKLSGDWALCDSMWWKSPGLKHEQASTFALILVCFNTHSLHLKLNVISLSLSLCRLLNQETHWGHLPTFKGAFLLVHPGIRGGRVVGPWFRK